MSRSISPVRLWSERAGRRLGEGRPLKPPERCGRPQGSARPELHSFPLSARSGQARFEVDPYRGGPRPRIPLGDEPERNGPVVGGRSPQATTLGSDPGLRERPTKSEGPLRERVPGGEFDPRCAAIVRRMGGEQPTGINASILNRPTDRL